jgi:hypothetical protein
MMTVLWDAGVLIAFCAGALLLLMLAARLGMWAAELSDWVVVLGLLLVMSAGAALVWAGLPR